MRFLSPGDLAAFDARSLAALVETNEMVVAAGAGEIRGAAAAALFFADYSLLIDGATIVIDTPAAWAGAAWRLGHAALTLLLQPSERSAGEPVALTAAGAVERGLCDEISELSPEAWLESWTRSRSLVALESAALLIRARGGQPLERAEFARLFAIGEPQQGLEAFLGRRGGRV